VALPDPTSTDLTTDSPPAPAEAPRVGWRRRILRWTARGLLGLLLVWAGLHLLLTHQAADPAYGGPVPVPAEVAARFAYPEFGSPVELLSEFAHSSGPGYVSRWVHFEVTTPGEESPHRVQVIHYAPWGWAEDAPASRPAVVISPILGGKNEVAEILARSLALRGFHAGVVLRAETYFDAQQPDNRMERVMRTAIVDRRRTVDWLSGLPGVDPQRIGGLGVSMGGIGNSVLAAVEPRIQAVVIVMAGADLGDIMIHSEERRIGRFVAERALQGLAPAPLRDEIRRAIISDPLHLAKHVDARRTLFVQTQYDRSVPTANQELLFEALGRPRRILVPTGHYTSGLYGPYLIARAIGFLEEQLR
jgi:dienelactone hydrolase